MKKKCEFCNGTGQTSYFKGVSRFLLSVEECLECAGLGFVVVPDADDKKKEKKKHQTAGEDQGKKDSPSTEGCKE